MGLFIKRTSLVKSPITDILKSKRTERQWTRGRFGMETAIKRWHHSLEGRRMHRKLGRFLATRPQYDRLFIQRDATI